MYRWLDNVFVWHRILYKARYGVLRLFARRPNAGSRKNEALGSSRRSMLRFPFEVLFVPPTRPHPRPVEECSWHPSACSLLDATQLSVSAARPRTFLADETCLVSRYTRSLDLQSRINRSCWPASGADVCAKCLKRVFPEEATKWEEKNECSGY